MVRREAFRMGGDCLEIGKGVSVMDNGEWTMDNDGEMRNAKLWVWISCWGTFIGAVVGGGDERR